MVIEPTGTPYDFPVVSDRRRNLLEEDADAEAPQSRLHASVETVYEAANDDFERGKEIGSVAITHARRQGQVPFSAYFSFDGVDGGDPDTVTVVGPVPGGDNDWNGTVDVTVVDGTGKFRGRVGKTMPLRSQNPKRWG